MKTGQSIRFRHENGRHARATITRLVKAGFVAIAIALFVGTAAGCGEDEILPSTTVVTEVVDPIGKVDGIAIVAGNTANNPIPMLPEQLQAKLAEYVAGGGTPVLISATSSPQTIPVKLIPVDPEKGTPSGNAERANMNVEDIGKALATPPAAPGLCLFEGLTVAHDALAGCENPLYILVGSGLDDHGSMATTKGLLMVTCTKIAEYVVAENPNLDLKGANIILVSFGYTALPQEPLTDAQRRAVTRAWIAVLEAFGAHVVVEPLPGSGTSVKTDKQVVVTRFAQPFLVTASSINYTFDSALLPFAKGSSQLGPEKDSALAEAVATLKACPAARIKITGHTDGDGDIAYNEELSRMRAEAVATYLRSKVGRDLDITIIAKGETEPKIEEAGLIGLDLEIAQARNRSIDLCIEGTSINTHP